VLEKQVEVIEIIDEYKVIINIDNEDVRKNDRFIIFEKQEELFDPDTKENLGFLEIPKLEIPKLEMVVCDIQDKTAILENSKREKTKGEPLKIGDSARKLN
jgi:hypothetical protein